MVKDDGYTPQRDEGLKTGRKLMLDPAWPRSCLKTAAETILEGPATMEIRSPAGIAFDRGKLAVTADKPSAHGFTVVSPGMMYTDLGTEFGVMVAPSGQQEVHVFRGREQRNKERGAGSGTVTASPNMLHNRGRR